MGSGTPVGVHVPAAALPETPNPEDSGGGGGGYQHTSTGRPCGPLGGVCVLGNFLGWLDPNLKEAGLLLGG